MVDILVVEDSKVLSSVLVQFLHKSMFNPTVAFNGLEALEKIEENRPDLIISDLEMPKMDGFELLGKISKEKDPIPVIIITGKDFSREDFDWLQNQSAFRGLLKKPFLLGELRCRIEAYLGL